MKLSLEGAGISTVPAVGRCGCFGGKPSPVWSQIFAVGRAAALAADTNACHSGRLLRSGCGVGVAGRLLRSAGIVLACAVFASALLGSAPAWSQSLSASVLTFVAATTDTTTEGGDDVELSIGLPQSHVGSRVEIELTVISTALAGSDYTLVAADSTPAITLGTGQNSTLTLVVQAAPAELSLRLRPRAADRISQGDRFLNLRISRYRVVPETTTTATVDLPPALDLTIRDDEPPTVQRIQVGLNVNFACVLLTGGSLRCAGNDRDGRATPPENLGPVAQFGVGGNSGCALTILGQLRCWGRESFGEIASPADDLGPFTQLVVGGFRSCALSDLGQVYCWGESEDGRSSPPDELGPGGALGPVAQVALGDVHSCALTVLGAVRCWGSNENGDGRTIPPGDLGPVAQIVLGDDHSCALTVSGEVRCWGSIEDGRSTPPDELGPGGTLGAVVQLAAGLDHTCALTELGELRCWGDDAGGQASPPDDLGPVAQLMLGRVHTCVRTVSGQLRCWGNFVAVSSLPPGSVTAIDAAGECALLGEGSMVCPNNPELVPLELRLGEAVMSVWPRQLQPGQRAAIRFADLRDTARAFSARIEVFGEGTADVSSHYRLLDHNGRPLSAEGNGIYLLGRRPLPIAGEPPMGWLEATLDGRGSRLYVRPLELLRSPVPRSARAPSIRMVAQPVELVELSDRPFLAASADTLTEGAEEVQLSIWLPPAHTGLRVELELLASGTARAGTDYTLLAADSPPGIMLGIENSTITLVVESAPTEPLRLRLLSGAEDRISQGPRFLNLRISRYRVAAEGGGAVDSPPALDFTIRDGDPPTVQQLQVGQDGNFACILLTGAVLRCVGDNSRDRATPPADLGQVAQVSLSNNHACALTVSGEVRCWGLNGVGQASPPDDLGPAVQVGVNGNYSCGLAVAGEVRCWGLDVQGLTMPPVELGPDGALGAVVQIGLGRSHVCALTASGEVRCWGNPVDNRTSPPDDLGPDGALGAVAQLAVGDLHNCVLTDLAQVRCWGANGNPDRGPDGRAMPPDDLGAVVQLGVGDLHSCALTVSGEVRCWGANGNPDRGPDGRATPPDDLGPVVQITVGEEHSCALTVLDQLRCWGDVVDVSSLPPGAVTAVDASGLCAVLVDGSLYCPNDLSLAPSELRPGAVVMSVWPQQLRPGQRAAIRFTDRRVASRAFTARIEVFGEGTEEVGSYYRLLDSNGQPLSAEPDGSYLLRVDPNSPQTAGNSLEALSDGRLSRLYVRPIELLVASGSVPSIRPVAQPVELIDGPFLAASTDTLVEGGEELPLSIWLPLAHTGLAVELELTAAGTALEGLDYTLDVADSEPGIMLGGGLDSMITLRVDSAPIEPLRLRLRSRADDRISQGDRFLNLRLSGYRVVAAGGGTADLPPALDLIIRDDDPPVAQRVIGGGNTITCARLNGDSLRCWGDSRAAPPDDLGAVVQFAVDQYHACAVTVSGEVRCWGSDNDGQASPPDNLVPVAQIDVGEFHSCAVTVSGEVRCWGYDGSGRTMPPVGLAPVAQISLGSAHSCALTVSGQVRCWGENTNGKSTPPADLGPVAQLGSGDAHSCALTVLGQPRCWGSDEDGRSTPPEGLEPVVQLGVGDAHSCVRTVSGRVHCWGSDEDGRSMPPDDLGPVAQLEVGLFHSCAVTVSGRLRCWGAVSRASLSLPPDTVTAIDPSGRCALLAEGSVYCPNPRFGIQAPLELRPGDVAMSVWPRQLGAGQRAAIRFADLRETTAAFTARIEVFGDGSEDIGSDYRLLDDSGQPLDAEDDGSYLIEGGAENPPMAWLESQASDRSLRLYVRPLELLPVSGPTPTIRIVAQPIELAAEVLGSLTLTGPGSMQTQTVPAEAVLFELTVTAAGDNGTRPWQPTEVLRLQHAAAPGVIVAFDSMLRFTAGVATVTVSVTPSPGTDAVVTFSIAGDSADLAAVVTNLLTVNVGVAEVLSTVTLTVPGERMRTVRSGKEEILITVQVMTEYLLENEPGQTLLRLRAVATNGVEASGPADVIVPTGGSTTTTLSLILGTARQTTVSFEVVGLPSGASLISPELRVVLVPVPASLELSALPQARLDLEPRGQAVAEFRVRVEIQGSDDLPFGGLNDLVLGITATEVDAGEAGDLVFSSAALEETAVGVYESTVRVTIAADLVSAASIEITVAGGGTDGLASAPATVQLARQATLDSLTLSLSDTSLEQSAAGESVQTEATVMARDQFQRPFSPTGLRLRVVDTGDGSEVLVTTPALVFDAQGEVQSLLSLTPPPATDQVLRVELVGVIDPEVSSNTAALELIAAGVLSTVTLTVPDGLIRTVESGQELILIEVRLMTEFLGQNDPEQTTLLLRAVGTNGVVASAAVAVIVPTGGSTTTTLSLILGTARQSTVSFEVVELPAGASLISPELRVELVPVPASLAISALPQARLDLEPRGQAVAEFRVRVDAQGSDGQPFGGLSDLVLGTTVTAVADGNAGDLAFLSAALEESAVGVYESTVRVTIAAGQVSLASIEITVEGAGLASAPVTVQLARQATLGSLMLSLSDTSLEQSTAGGSVQTTATVIARDQFGDFFSPTGLRLRVVDTGDGSEVLVTTPELAFDVQGEVQSLLSLTPPRGMDQNLRVELIGVTDSGVTSNATTLTLTAAGVLSTVTLTVQDGLIRTVESGQELILIEVRLMTEFLGQNYPEQTTLLLRAVGTNGVVASAAVAVIVPTGESTTTVLSLMLGTARQSTVSFEVVDLPAGASLISPELRVELVPVPASLAISALPQARLDLEPRREAVAEFRVRVDAQGSDGQPFGGLSDLVLGTTVTAVADGNAGDLAFLSAALEESAAGVYESTVRVTIAAGQVSMASIEITVEGAGLAGVAVTVQLARQAILGSLMLSLSETSLEQSAAGGSVQTTATVLARDQFGDFFSPTGLRLRVVDTDDGSVVLVTTPELAFDVQGEVQSLLSLTPPRGMDQNLRVELIGVIDPEVSSNTAALELIAVELLGSLTVTGPSSTPTQTVPAEAVLFELTVTAAGTKGTRPWQPTEVLRLQHTAPPGVMADYQSPLNFSAGVATVTVSVTPDPGNDALVTFSVTTEDPAALADLIGVAISSAELTVGAVEVLSTVTLTVSGERMRTVGSGQEEILITVELMTESFGGNEAQQRELTLRAVATNGVEASSDVVVVIGNGSGTAALSLMLGDAEQTTVSFEVVNLPAAANFISQEVRVELVLVPASLAISVLPQAMLELAPRAEAVAEFRVRVEVQGSDGQPFGGLNDLVLGTTVTEVVAGDTGDIELSFEPLAETATGVHESTVRVTIAADQVSMASVEITVAGSGLAGAPALVQLVRQATLDSLMLSLSDAFPEQSASGESVQTTATVMARDRFQRPLSPTGLRLRVVDTGDGSVVLVTTPALVFDTRGEAQEVLSLTPLPATDRVLRVEVIGVGPGVTGNTAALTLIAAGVLSTVTLTVQDGLIRTVESGQELILIEVQLMTEYLGENDPEQTALLLRAVATNGVETLDPVAVVVPVGGSTATLSLMLGDAEQTTVSFEVVDLPSGANLISQEVRVELVPVPVSLAISALPQAMLELEPRREAVAEFRVRVDVQGSDGQPFGGLSDLVLGTTVTSVADGNAGDLALLSAALEESAAGVYESTVRVTIAAGQVSMASVGITVAGSGLAGVPALVQLARQVTLDSLMLSLSETSLEQSAAGESVQTTATVMARDQFQRPFSPAGLRLRVVDTGDGSVVLVTTPALVFDAGGEVQEVLSLTPPRGTGQDLRVELVGVTDAEVSTATVDLRIAAAEALGRVILTVPGGSRQFVSMDTFSIDLELSLASAGNRPLTAETTLTVLIQVSVAAGSTSTGPSQFPVSVSGETPSSVEIEGMFIDNAVSTTISLSIVGGVPADVSVLIRPANTVQVRLAGDLDVDGNGVFDVGDAVLILMAINMSLPDSISPSVRAQLDELLNPDNPDTRLDVDGNGLLELIDMRILLRYLAGLRGDALMENAADTEASERRAREIIERSR